jgi:hypothetical protein
VRRLPAAQLRIGRNPSRRSQAPEKKNGFHRLILHIFSFLSETKISAHRNWFMMGGKRPVTALKQDQGLRRGSRRMGYDALYA